MSFNDNDFINDELIGGGEAKPYVPRFEQDLQKAGGNLSALAQQKEAEQNAAEAVKPEEHVYETPAYEEPVQAVQQNIFENPNTDYDEAALDYVYDGDENYSYSGALEDISAESIALEDMDVKLEEMRTDKSSIISSLKSQMMQDDLAMSVEGRPQLDEMSDIYGPSKQKKEDIMLKNKLDRNEKDLLKNQLKSQLESKSKDYDRRKSAEMYKALMAEQHAREAKKGLLVLLVTAVFGLITAGLIYVLNSKVPEARGVIPSLQPLAIAAAAFSVFMFAKSGFFKITSVLFFILNSIALIGPGLLVFAMSPDNQKSDNYLLGIILTVAAIIFSFLTAFSLVTNKDIKNYYSYKPEKKKGRKK
ncbi:MAG: Bax inhibitor-1/YccA family protein [Oscillospiraceae bacterium]|nr:Bax inhibitor-1/YccA family protein [Oscillospiraceae bacterium]